MTDTCLICSKPADHRSRRYEAWKDRQMKILWACSRAQVEAWKAEGYGSIIYTGIAMQLGKEWR